MTALQNTKPEIWIGLDTGVASTALCAIDHNGKVLIQQELPTKAARIRNLLVEHFPEGVRAIGMEACSTSLQVVKGLRAFGYDANAYDTFAVRRFLELRKNKTDKNDARGIAEVARLGRGFLVEVHIKSNECYSTRSKLVARHNMVRQRVSTELMIKSTLRVYGTRIKERSHNSSRFRFHVERAIEEVRAETGHDLTQHMKPLLELSMKLRTEIANLESELHDFVMSNDLCRRFTEIPGVSSITAVSFFTAIEDPTRFRRSTDVAAYLGLTPKIFESGDSKRNGGITKAGNPMTRVHLVSAATVMLSVAKKHDTALRRWGLERAEAIGFAKARVAVARKLAVIMLNMWRTGRSYEAFPEVRDPEPLPVAA
ncbi:IS110 family transposase [Sphingomonas populi]|uniref:IS110 family transposase n=1 Tax=Sphingomonas populi TaxID=2484750 RepID=A0A4Q6Y4I1_9SPHN|nr:IS110 family transposase [Sphingomonas populi]RZF64319.1 IS110 family transposase [Sphingomonas populi]